MAVIAVVEDEKRHGLGGHLAQRFNQLRRRKAAAQNSVDWVNDLLLVVWFRIWSQALVAQGPGPMALVAKGRGPV